MKTALNFVVCLLLYSTGAAAEEYHWTAGSTIEHGTLHDCGYGQEFFTKVSVVVKDGILKSRNDMGIDLTVPLETLNADGSGRITIKDRNNRDVIFDFDAGTGPRKIHVRPALSPCMRLWTPVK